MNKSFTRWLAFLAIVSQTERVYCQTTTDVRDLSTNFYTYTNGGGVFAHNGGIGMWANQGLKEVWTAYQFCNDESDYNNCVASARKLQNGDSLRFQLNGSQAIGEVGVILSSNPSFSYTYSSKNSGSALELYLGGHGNSWQIIHDGSNISTGLQSSTSNKTWDVTIKITSSSTAKVTMTDGTTSVVRHANLKNETGISHIVFYLKDDWNGSSNSDFHFGFDGNDLSISNNYNLLLNQSSSDLIYGSISDPVELGTTSTTPLSIKVVGNVEVQGSVHIAGALDVDNSSQLTLGLDNSNSFSQLKFSTLPGGGVVAQEQYLNGTGHHAISSSMMDGFTTSGANTNALYSYNASSGAYNMSPNTTSAGEGYFAPVGTNGFLSTSGVFSLSGTPVTSHTHNLGFAANQQSGGSGSGWNLIGNPYTCSLDWSSVTKPGTLNNAIYIWDPNTSSYKYWVDGTNPPNPWSGTYAGSQLASALIAPMQAFWVQTTASTTLSTSMAAHGSTASTVHYKKNPDNLILIAREVDDSTKADAMWLKNVPGTTLGFEGSEDAWKMTNYGGQPMIYSVDLDEKLAINAIDLNGPSVTPVGFSAPNAGGKYRISLEQVVNDLPYTAVLEDKLFGTFIDLTQGDYSFTHAGWQSEGPRFALHTVSSALSSPDYEASALVAYQDGTRLVVMTPNSAIYQLVALDGRVLREGALEQGANALPLGTIPSGIYVLRTEGHQIKSVKISLTNN